MDDEHVILALAALAQPTRLNAFKALVANVPEGVPAGELAKICGVPQNTMSSHLAILQRARLVSAHRHSRLIIYRAELDHFRAITLHLVQDCCGGRPEVCAPIIQGLAPSCSPQADVA